MRTHEEIFSEAQRNSDKRDATRTGFLANVNAAVITTGEAIQLDYTMDKLPVWGLLSETTQGFAMFCVLLARLECLKGKQYRASFMKRGESEIKANVDRKYDRLEQWRSMTPLDNLKTLGDLAVYAVKWMEYICDLYPELLGEFLDELRATERGLS